MFYSILLSLCSIKNVKITNVVKELGISSGNLSKWKSGVIPKSDTLRKLADYFGVTTDYLLGREDRNKRPPSGDGTSPFELTAEEQAFLEKLRLVEQVNPKMLNHLEAMIDSMLK